MSMKGTANVELLGFDRSVRNGLSLTVGCSRCDALVINGVPCHELGCRNAMHECAGCNVYVPTSVKYCEDCAS
jgi:hypothetical protein